jgi:hypothetical protein
MVKRRSHSMAALALACAVMLSGCAVRGPFVTIPVESLPLSHGPAAPFLSLAHSTGELLAVYADRETTTLNFVQLPDGPHLPSSPPAREVIDRVDTVPPLSPAFGEHVLAVAGNNPAVLYLDRKTDARNVLKLVTRQYGDKEWSLDVLEPTGSPLDLQSDRAGGFAAAWAPGQLARRGGDGRAADIELPVPFQLQGRPSADGSGGFTAFDTLTARLYAVRWTGSGFVRTPVPGASSTHASLRDGSGRLLVLSWIEKTRRLMLFREAAAGGGFSAATVTVCDGTKTVALLPGQSDANFLILFDEVRSIGAGKSVSQVSLIAPGSLIGARGTRYRKAVLSSGDALVDGFAAARTVDALYVLVSQGNLKLLRTPLAGQ